jgi:hypothetical protein
VSLLILTKSSLFGMVNQRAVEVVLRTLCAMRKISARKSLFFGPQGR